MIELRHKELRGGMVLRLAYDTSYGEYHVTGERGQRTVRRSFPAASKPKHGYVDMPDRLTIQEIEDEVVDMLTEREVA